MIEPYNDEVRALFADPAHVGELPDAPCGWFEDQGVRIRFAATAAGDTLTQMRFLAYGCPHVIAACEWVCRAFEGGPITALEALQTARIMESLAVPVEKTGRILVVEDTLRSLRAAIRDLSTTD